VNNLIEILNDFLSLGKLEEGAVPYKPEPLQVSEFVKTIIEDNRSILKKDQKINYRHINGNHHAEADLQMFKNIILNLLSNAVKYSKEGQTIDITTEVKPGVVEIIELKVKDYGVGIPEADQKHIFSRFFRAKNAINIEGTGLGLNIVKKYVELMHGSVLFTSELEKGTEFVVKIPVRVSPKNS
ncbi:MAG: sensor histidine kinase, partial [Bacteroidia bacterium]